MKPDLRFRSTTTSCPPPRSIISTRASSITCRVTSLSRRATSSTSTRGRVQVSMLTSPPLSDDAQRDLAGSLEDGHADALRPLGLRPADDAHAVGAVAGRAGARHVGKSTLPKNEW